MHRAHVPMRGLETDWLIRGQRIGVVSVGRFGKTMLEIRRQRYKVTADHRGEWLWIVDERSL